MIIDSGKLTKGFLNLFRFIIVSAALSGCAMEVDSFSQFQLTFFNLPSVKLKVNQINSQTALVEIAKNDIGVRLPLYPVKVLEQWAKHRLKPVGSKNREVLRFIIKEASVIETSLKPDYSIKGIFRGQNSHKYVFAFEAVIQIIGRSGNILASSSAKVTRSITIPEGLSLSERELLLLNVIDKLMSQFDQEMLINISKFFEKWLI